MESQLFISTSELASLLGSVQILDSGMNVKESHFQQRIPGAKYFSITEIRKSLSPLSQEIPTLPEAVEYMKKLGIRNDGSLVVTYDQNGFAMAGRAWFFLKHFGYPNVKILDGGLVKWLAEGREVESGVYDVMGNTSWKDEDFSLSEVPDDRVFHSEVSQLVPKIVANETSTRIWDPRPPEMFNQGTVDSAVNVPIGAFFNPDKTVKTPQEVSQILQTRLGDGEIITSCGKGNLASLAYALLVYAGRNQRKLYSGSLEEWNSLKSH